MCSVMGHSSELESESLSLRYTNADLITEISIYILGAPQSTRGKDTWPSSGTKIVYANFSEVRADIYNGPL